MKIGEYEIKIKDGLTFKERNELIKVSMANYENEGEKLVKSNYKLIEVMVDECEKEGKEFKILDVLDDIKADEVDKLIGGINKKMEKKS